MLFFVKCAGLGRAGLWMVGTLLWPFGQHYLVYAIYGGYYPIPRGAAGRVPCPG